MAQREVQEAQLKVMAAQDELQALLLRQLEQGEPLAVSQRIHIVMLSMNLTVWICNAAGALIMFPSLGLGLVNLYKPFNSSILIAVFFWGLLVAGLFALSSCFLRRQPHIRYLWKEIWIGRVLGIITTVLFVIFLFPILVHPLLRR